MKTLASAILPEAGQRAIINSGDVESKLVLAYSPTTSQENIDKLIEDDIQFVREGASLRTRNVDALRDTIWGFLAGRSEHDWAVRACRNPLAPQDLLVELLDNRDPMLAFLAYLNPNTPEEARRKLTAERAEFLTWFEDVVVYKHMWTTELVLANPWMAETPTIWSHYIRHIIAESPYTPTTAIETLTNSIGCAHECEHVEFWRNETMYGANTQTVDETIDALQKLTYANLYAATQPDFTEEQATSILNQPWLPTANVMGRIVNKFGGTILLKAKKSWDDDYLELCSQLAPTLWYGQYDDYVSHQDIRQACDILGNSDENWHAYVSLIRDWYGTYTEAALTVCRL